MKMLPQFTMHTVLVALLPLDSSTRVLIATQAPLQRPENGDE